eukprot:SAG22_NODE_2446_length_2562_cov_2.956963_1_plen_214_part_00
MSRICNLKIVPGEQLNNSTTQQLNNAGLVRAWDPRAGPAVAAMSLHNHGADGAGAVVGLELASSKALSFCCASTVFLSKTAPFRVVPLSQAGGGMLLSAGADRLLHTVDPRLGWQPCASYMGHADFIYCMRLLELGGGGGSGSGSGGGGGGGGGDLVALSGGGDGMLHAHDARTGAGLWSVRASSKGAVQGIAATADTVVTANDDGNVAVFHV